MWWPALHNTERKMLPWGIPKVYTRCFFSESDSVLAGYNFVVLQNGVTGKRQSSGPKIQRPLMGAISHDILHSRLHTQPFFQKVSEISYPFDN